MDFKFDIIIHYLPVLFKGTMLTIGFSIVSIIIGSILGLGIGFGKMAPRWYFRWPFHLYINFFRGTPLYVQILIVHFGVVPPIYGKTNALISGVVALSLNSAAYSAEIFRAGIQSIDRGQKEAAISLGMSSRQAMRFIILPQAIKRMVPAFGNEFIVLVKDSSLMAIVAAPEIMYWSNTMKGQYLRIWEPYLTAALIYFILTYSLSKLLNYLERRV
ncbi:amino acid ABC transporter permease [Paenibacillus monticola]|uniref:ABC transporter permease subunit n=1 Tax=Paenibacillus monticola TaxID=2666075 RepID=A0A7X2H853_9BACL|nr:amino acid ABC transporter permease [Paenibacillus monticola]MRN55304.1 ABC transporter permease subunit [Paenibacillus monticola]